MHIEPGFVVQSKIILANVGAVGVMGLYAKDLLAKPQLIVRTVLAAIFFSLFMQLFHLPAGPSELHLLGAMPIYLLLGFVPALFGFALGLLFQGLAFAPTDLAHLSINSLSLMLPLIAVHMAFGKNLKTKDLSLKSLAKLDSAFYAGVTLMVGFWLLGEGVTSFATWAVFAASYAPIVLGEIAFTVGALQLVQKFGQNNLVAYCFGEMKAA